MRIYSQILVRREKYYKNGYYLIILNITFLRLRLMVQNLFADKLQFILCKRPSRGMQYRNFPKTGYLGFPYTFTKKTRLKPEILHSKSYFICYPLSETRCNVYLYTIPISKQIIYAARRVYMQVTHFSYGPLAPALVFLGLFDLCAHTDCQPHAAVVPHTTSCSARNTSASI